MMSQAVARGAWLPLGWFSLPEPDDEVLIAFRHGATFDPMSLGAVESRLHDGAALIGGLRAIILVRPAQARIHGRPKWGDVVLKAWSEDAALTLADRLWLTGLPEPAHQAVGPRGPASVKFGDTVLPYAALPNHLTVRVSEASGAGGEYVLTSVRHLGGSADGLARVIACDGLARRR